MNQALRTPVECQYALDSTDRIVAVSPAWDAVAHGYQASAATSRQVIGQPWPRFVSGAITKQVYDLLFRRVRATGTSTTFTIRCDQPAEKRLLQLTIAPAANSGIAVTTQLLEATPRPPVALFGHGRRQTATMLVLCSWCSRFQTAPSHWQEAEDAMPVLGLFSGDELPRLSHGMCNDCFVRVTDTVAGH